MARRREVRVGDRFRKNSWDNTVWIVSGFRTLPGDVPHVRLAKEGSPKDMITVSVNALNDQRLFLRAPQIEMASA